ncbi:MAG: protein-disulfide reductase DsbD domain-containing protein [Sneathiella sp.]|uniref:protein-disulfide reductase DsbD domain-containing protein n=1 Tax=Sneathiella sp. TaxID=1964365 RepID=UPI0030024E18
MKSAILFQSPLYLLAFFAFATHTARAGSATDWEETEQSKIRLISEVDGVKGHESIRIGLQVQLQKGWKIYWRSPGDAGIPPQFDWSGSMNFKQSTIHWPAPEQFDVFGLTTWGYHDEVVYPITVDIEDSSQPLDLKLKLFYGICEQVCIPYQHEFSLSLPADTGELSLQAPIIEEFVDLIPHTVGDDLSTISLVTAKLTGETQFSVTAVANGTFKDPKIALEGKEGVFFAVLSSRISSDGRSAIFDVEADFPTKKDHLKGQTVTVTVFDQDFASEGMLAIN